MLLAEKCGRVADTLQGLSDRVLGTATDPRSVDPVGAPTPRGCRITRSRCGWGEPFPGMPTADAAGYVEGFLAGGGLLLVHDERLLALVDSWLGAVPDDAFLEGLPLLRRTFGTFAAPGAPVDRDQGSRAGRSGRTSRC